MVILPPFAQGRLARAGAELRRSVDGSHVRPATMLQAGRHHAFTLIELLVVISIIGVLITIMVPALQAAKYIAGEKVCGSNLRSLNIGMLAYGYSNSNEYPLEPTEHNPHPGLMQKLISTKCATSDLFYCPQATVMEKAAQNGSYAPIGAVDSVINTPENNLAGNISYVYYSFRQNKAYGSQTWREAQNFLPRKLFVNDAQEVDPAKPLPVAEPQERWVMSDFFRKGAPFPHARNHARGLNVIFQDGHANLIFGSPKTVYR